MEAVHHQLPLSTIPCVVDGAICEGPWREWAILLPSTPTRAVTPEIIESKVKTPRAWRLCSSSPTDKRDAGRHLKTPDRGDHAELTSHRPRAVYPLMFVLVQRFTRKGWVELFASGWTWRHHTQEFSVSLLR